MHPEPGAKCVEAHGLGARRLRLSIPATAMSVRAALERTRAGLLALGLRRDECSNVEVVLAEAMNNICEHAYEGRPDGRIDVTIDVDDAEVRCELVDRGLPMPNRIAPPGFAVAIDCELDDLPEGGFGWFLIRELSSELVYQRRGEQNHLTFRLPRSAPGAEV